MKGGRLVRNNIRFTISVATILIFVGLAFLSYNYINTKRELTFNTMNLELSNDEITTENSDQNNEQTEENQQENTENQQEENKTEENKTYEYYIGKLEIPKINFSRGFYDKNSTLNNVKWNIKVLKESDYPDVNNGNLIIIGHSGNYSNSYFSILYKLTNDDLAYVYYKNKKYTYKVVNIYNEVKDGNLAIKRNPNKSVLTLITCTKDDQKHQTIYILELVDKSNT